MNLRIVGVPHPDGRPTGLWVADVDRFPLEPDERVLCSCGRVEGHADGTPEGRPS